MMDLPVRIFCEGFSDQRFLRDFLDVHYQIEISDKELEKNEYILKLGSWKNLKIQKTKITETFSENTTIIFLDADDVNTLEKAGFSASKKFIDDLMNDWNWTKYDKYIFPNNENQIGEVEDLLENIINQSNQSIFECWEEYENCIKTNNKFKTPAIKSKIYTYKECLNSLGNYNFKDERLWDLKNLTNPYLKNLKTFLDQYLLQNE